MVYWYYLTLSSPVVSNGYASKCSGPYWSKPPFSIFDIRALWRSVLCARVLECPKIKKGGLDQYGAEPTSRSNGGSFLPWKVDIVVSYQPSHAAKMCKNRLISKFKFIISYSGMAPYAYNDPTPRRSVPAPWAHLWLTTDSGPITGRVLGILAI